MNTSSSFQSNGGEDSDAENALVNSEAPISISVLISLVAGVFIGFYDRNNKCCNFMVKPTLRY